MWTLALKWIIMKNTLQKQKPERLSQPTFACYAELIGSPAHMFPFTVIWLGYLWSMGYKEAWVSPSVRFGGGRRSNCFGEMKAILNFNGVWLEWNSKFFNALLLVYHALSTVGQSNFISFNFDYCGWPFLNYFREK